MSIRLHYFLLITVTILTNTLYSASSIIDLLTEESSHSIAKSVVAKRVDKERKAFHSVKPELLIGSDDRVFSNDPRVGRFVINSKGLRGGTGWLTACGCILTAGHVANLIPIQIEFNVPMSKPDGSPVASNPEDIYDIIHIKSFYIKGESEGKDWAIYRPNLNAITKKSVFEKQKKFFRIIDDWGSINASPLVRVSGYGDDSTHLNPRITMFNRYHRTLQTDAGILSGDDKSGPDKNIIRYSLDTMNSCSGSPVYLAGTHLALAIHTNAVDSFNNAGTGFKNTLLIDAIKGFLRINTYVDSNYFFTVPVGDGSLFKPYRRLEDGLAYIKGTGGKIGIVSGYYPAPAQPLFKPGLGGISFPKALAGKVITVKALAGKVHIGKVKVNN